MLISIGYFLVVIYYLIVVVMLIVVLFDFSIGLWFGSCLRILVVAGSFAVGYLLIVLLFSIFFICGCIDM